MSSSCDSAIGGGLTLLVARLMECLDVFCSLDVTRGELSAKQASYTALNRLT